MVKKFLALSVVTLGLMLSAQASTIGNGSPNQSGGSDLNSFQEADDFNTGAGGAEITHVQFWALASGLADFTGSVNWGFYTNVAGSPGVAVASGNSAATMVADGNTTFGLNEYALNFDLDVNLAANTTYWLVLHNGPSNTDPSIAGSQFYWAWSNGTGGNSQGQDITAPGWVGNDAELAFQVTAVPEPASLSLIAGGLMTGWLKRRNMHAKK